MTLKLRLALLITFIVLFISVLSSVSVLILYSNHREEDFYSRLKAETTLLYDEYIDGNLAVGSLKKKLPAELDDKFLFDKQMQILDADKTIIFSDPNNEKLIISGSAFVKTLLKKEYAFHIGSRQFNMMYIDATKKVVVVSAIDKDGLEKLARLKFILFVVSATAIIISILLSYFFVITVLKPLTTLSKQMADITENNLFVQVEVGKRKDEITNIAVNFNTVLQKLGNAFENQKNFVHHASHELRTPLATMHATTEAALHKNLNEDDFRATLLSLKEDQNNLIELTNSLLLLSQFEKLQLKPHWSVIRIDELIIDAISYCQKLFSGIAIDFSFASVPEDDSWLEVNANETLLKSAFTNLIKNAFLYSNDKRISIILATSKDSTEIYFDNKGKNLSQQQLENITKPFYSHSNVGQFKGFGLGLSIVEKIISFNKAQFIYQPIDKDTNRFIIKFK